MLTTFTLLDSYLSLLIFNKHKILWIIVLNTESEVQSPKSRIFSIDQIKSHTKDSFKRLVKEHVIAAAFEYLKNLQKTHSKARPLQYETFKMQEYLGSESKLSLKEKAFTFAIRTRMIDLKSNFKVGQKDLKCRLCDKHEEDQQGLLLCPALNSEPVKTSRCKGTVNLSPVLLRHWMLTTLMLMMKIWVKNIFIYLCGNFNKLTAF